MRRKVVIFSLLLYLVSLTSASAVDEIISRVNEVVCILLCIIWYVVAALAALLLLLAGVKYLTSESEEGRDEAKSRIVQAITGLIIVIIALPLVNFLIQNTKIMEFGKDCDCAWIPSPTTTTTLPAPGTTTTTPVTTTTPLPCVAFSPPNCAEGSCPPGQVCMKVGGNCQCQAGVSTSTVTITSTIFANCENECILKGRPGGSCKSSCPPENDLVGQNGCGSGKVCCCNPVITTSTSTTTSTTTTSSTSSTTSTTLPTCAASGCPDPDLGRCCTDPEGLCQDFQDFHGDTCFPSGKININDYCGDNSFASCCCSYWGTCCS